MHDLYLAQARVIQAAIAARQPLFLQSDPGEGKNGLLSAIAAQMGLPYECVTLIGREPGDLLGLPIIGENADGTPNATMAAPDWARRLATAGKGVLLLDEIGSCDPAVAGAACHVLAERHVGNLRLPDDVIIVCAGNPIETAANGFMLPAPASNRLLHLDFTGLDAEAFTLGLIAGFELVTPVMTLSCEVSDSARTQTAMSVGGFLQTFPDYLSKCPPRAEAQAKAWPSRRSWAGLAAVLAHLNPDDHSAVSLATAGMVGDGAATEYQTWLRFGDLPNPADVLNNPSLLDFTGRSDRVFAVLAGVVAVALADGKTTTWNKAWTVLAAAEPAGCLDVAGVAARTLLSRKPKRATMPAEAAAFAALFDGSGLTAAA